MNAAYLLLPISAYLFGSFFSEWMGKSVTRLNLLRWDTNLAKMAPPRPKVALRYRQKRGGAMSIFGWMDANDDGIPDSMLYYDLCTGGKAAKAAAARKKNAAASPAGGASGRTGAGTGGRLNLGKVRKIQSGHVPESLRHPSDAPGKGRGPSRPR